MKFNFLLLFTCLFLGAYSAKSQSLADCDNLSLSIDTVYLFPEMDTVVTGDLYYNDTTFTVYPTLLLLIPENPYISSPDLMVLSSLDSGSVQWFELNVTFNNTDFPNNTIIPTLFHIYDSDWVGDSIVTCYLPLTLILQNEMESIGQHTNNAAINVYPNPADQFIQVTLNNASLINTPLQIINAMGQSVTNMTANSTNFSIDVSNYAEGIYFIVTKNSQYTITDFIVK